MGKRKRLLEEVERTWWECGLDMCVWELWAAGDEVAERSALAVGGQGEAGDSDGAFFNTQLGHTP